ncbi:MAG: hypothetical protein AB7K71_30235 [Polyangiaceae bacterium]
MLGSSGLTPRNERKHPARQARPEERPEVSITDPLKDTKYYIWSSDGRPNVTVSHQSLVFRWNKDFDLKQHRAYLRAIAGCKP